MSGPGVDCVTSFAPAIEEIVPVENDEAQTEAGLHFALPLGDEGSRASDDDALHLLAHDHFAKYEAGFNRFAESYVIGDEKIDARHLESLLQGLQLVRHDLDAGAMRRLEKSGIRGCDEIPAEGVDVSGEDVGRVKARASQMAPVGLLQDLGVDFPFPKDGKALALRVILQAGKFNERLLPTGITSGLDGFYKISATANLYDLARRRQKRTFPACSEREIDIAFNQL